MIAMPDRQVDQRMAKWPMTAVAADRRVLDRDDFMWLRHEFHPIVEKEKRKNFTGTIIDLPQERNRDVARFAET